MGTNKAATLRAVISTTMDPLPDDQNALFHLATVMACLSGVWIQSSRAVEGVTPILMGGGMGWLLMWVVRFWMTPPRLPPEEEKKPCRPL